MRTIFIQIGILNLIRNLDDKSWPLIYSFWEVNLIKELGFGFMTDKTSSSKDILSFSEAKKYIEKFKNKIFVIKYGGNALTDKYLANNFAKDIVLIKKLGVNVVIVHGGGPQISETLKKKKLKINLLMDYV